MQNKQKALYLTNTWVTILFIYYFLVFVTGLVLVCNALFPQISATESKPILELAMKGAIGMAANGSAIFYSRKLYKLCFSESLKLDKADENGYVRRLGTIVYFLFRPLFSIGFSILVVIGLRSGFMLTTEGEIELNDGFIYMVMFISFFVGFLSGSFIKKLEKSGEKVLSDAIK